ncbi:hypothetical protein TrLO_g8114 [Triparma laevis f. longispina]|uniref:Uncharacterized protein n=1 Tax=Triparma laevis f. longispina TaxID=1714387 RepID=A0A9W7F4E9_9STRA|nr:hypothetical protein TrLO_g8114 [Triparma laevis f. longispina]
MKALRPNLLFLVQILLISSIPTTKSFQFTIQSSSRATTYPRPAPRRHPLLPAPLHSLREPASNKNLRNQGLSRANTRLVKRDRQRFIPQQFPLHVSIQKCPTRSWLKNPLIPQSTSQLTLNGTSLEQSPANYDSILWMDDLDQTSEKNLAIEMVGEINTKSPAYLNIIRDPLNDSEELWISDFSLTSKTGGITKVHTDNGSMQRMKTKFPWPNEITPIPKKSSLLITDGFLIPTKNDGAVYVLQNPGRGGEEKVKLTCDSDWFYHRAAWVDLTNDGRQSILTARARRTGMDGVGELVWLERPKPPRISEETGLGLELDGTKFDEFSPNNTPWKCRKLCDGPDVMFCLLNLPSSSSSSSSSSSTTTTTTTTTNTVEVVSSQFFAKQVVLHSILKGDGSESAYIFRPNHNDQTYSLMCEIDCGATVGSLAVSYSKFCGEGEEGYAKLFVAAYERDKVFVFSFDPV